ncbi:MAG: hypothetical protein GX028_04035 [Clostridiaceae bacterium]|nr:hypothetical protein [Clostridiaceae bacterium]
MNPTRGNLAVTNSYHNNGGSAANNSYRKGMVIRGGKAADLHTGKPKLPKMRVRRVTTEDIGEVRKLARENARQQIDRQLAFRRFKALAAMVMVIALVAGVYGIIVFRQAMILESNFENLRIERTITKLEQESNQISESLAQKTNLDLIRRRAIDDLGLQDPARSQVISVFVPDTDRVVFASANAGAADQEAYLNNIFDNVEGFFKTLNQKRQVD